MVIQLSSPFTVQPAITTSTVIKHQVLDDATSQTVTAILIVGQTQTGDNIYHTMLLWQGEDYTAAGQWTDDDVAARINELLTNN